MIPGFNSGVLSSENEKASINRIQKFLHMLDSMNDDELDNKVPLDYKRMLRIARGSGSRIQEVQILYEEYKRISKMVGGLSKAKIGKGNDMTQIKRNPK